MSKELSGLDKLANEIDTQIETLAAERREYRIEYPEVIYYYEKKKEEEKTKK